MHTPDTPPPDPERYAPRIPREETLRTPWVGVVLGVVVWCVVWWAVLALWGCVARPDARAGPRFEPPGGVKNGGRGRTETVVPTSPQKLPIPAAATCDNTLCT